MPMHHHHHENQRDKRKERLMRLAAHSKGIAVADRPMLLIDIGEKRISELIRSVTGGNEDAFQDAWVAVLTDYVGTEDDILRIARDFLHTTHVHNYADVSLQEPWSHEVGHPFTLEDVIASPALVLEEPEPYHTRRRVYGNISVKHDVVERLRAKWPDVTLNLALRYALGLPVDATRYWKRAEIELLRRDYPSQGSEMVAHQLGRSITAVADKAKRLDLKRLSRIRTPCGTYTGKSILRIFRFSERQLTHVVSRGLLPCKIYRGMRLFAVQDIQSFIKLYPFEYRHELLEFGWRSYIPAETKEWGSISEMSDQAHICKDAIKDMVRRNEIPVKMYCPHSKFAWYVRFTDIENRMQWPKFRREPYKVMVHATKTHYVQELEVGYWTAVCEGKNAKYIWTPYLEELLGHSPEFKQGYPTCLKCLMIRKSKLIGKRASECK